MGIGYVAVKDKKIVAFQKGFNLDVRDISKKLRKMEYDWVIFHTRYASVGDKNNRNCHPFIKGNNAIAMNGTEQSVSFLNCAMDITDTEAIFKILIDYKLEIAALSNLRSIFVGFKNGEPYMVANNTSNIKILHNKKNNAIVFASEFPVKFKKNIYELKKEYIWCNSSINHRFLQPYKPTKEIDYMSLYDWYYFDDEYAQECFHDYKEGSDKIAV